VDLRKMKKRKAREAREAAYAAEAVTSTAALDPVPVEPETDPAIAAADDEAEADDRVEIAELMYQAALARDQVAEAKERAAAELVAAAEARELSFAERAVAVEEMERLVAERMAAADARDQAVAERIAAAEWREQAAAERVAAVESRERLVAERDAIANSRDRAGAERDTIANARDRAAVERESIVATHRSTPREGAADDLDPELERARLEAELQRAHLDALTGAFRREVGRLALRNEIERARRADGKFVIAFIDVDGLKGVNDRDGHAAGDRVLRMLAAIMRANLRPYDPIVRFGGDEFICGISSIDPGEVQHRIGVIDQSLRHATGVGITAGLASLTGAMESVDELTERADAALIEAKQNRS
jgi:diguanylate cyclase (GGDEF)-like protein